MATHQTQFSLPSIHELFPGMLSQPLTVLDGPDHHLSPSIEARKRIQPPPWQVSRGMSFWIEPIWFFNHRLQRPHTPRTRCSSYPPTQRMLQSRPYSHHTESLAHDPRLHESDPRPHAADHRKRSASQIYSFDVLRSDPMSSSLQHLTSSGNPPNHPSSSQQHHSHTSTSSEFRVSVPPTAAASVHSPQGQRSAPQPDPAVPAMISFPVSRPPASKSSKQSASDEASDEEVGETAGKKHICPTCLKRFNRPSSLRIHVNTHTGATRKNFYYKINLHQADLFSSV